MASGLGTSSQHITLMPSDYHQTKEWAILDKSKPIYVLYTSGKRPQPSLAVFCSSTSGPKGPGVLYRSIKWASGPGPKCRHCWRSRFRSLYNCVCQRLLYKNTVISEDSDFGGFIWSRPRTIFLFLLFLMEENASYHLSETFFGIRKYCSLPKLLHFEISKIHTITLCMWTSIANFWGRPLKLGSYVLFEPIL